MLICKLTEEQARRSEEEVFRLSQLMMLLKNSMCQTVMYQWVKGEEMLIRPRRPYPLMMHSQTFSGVPLKWYQLMRRPRTVKIKALVKRGCFRT